MGSDVSSLSPGSLPCARRRSAIPDNSSVPKFTKTTIYKEVREYKDYDVPVDGDTAYISYSITGDALNPPYQTTTHLRTDFIISSTSSHHDGADPPIATVDIMYLSDMVKSMKTGEQASFRINTCPQNFVDSYGGSIVMTNTPFHMFIELNAIIPGPIHRRKIEWHGHVKRRLTVIYNEQTNIDFDYYTSTLGIPQLFHKFLFLSDNLKLPDFIKNCSKQRGDITEQDLEALQKDIQKTPKRKELKIKLIITDIEFEKKKLGFLLPVVLQAERLFANSTYGFVHTALQIGPWLIEWNDSSLIIPRIVSETTPIMAIDLDHRVINSSSEIDKILETASRVCAEWNRTKLYTKLSCNCQHFVDDLLKELGITPKFTGAIQEFLQSIKRDGTWEKKFVKDGVEVIFKNHGHLDDYVKAHKDKLTKDDLLLLKSFDRAYWIQYHECMEAQRQARANFESYDTTTLRRCMYRIDGDSCGCAFEDPYGTLSLFRQ